MTLLYLDLGHYSAGTNTNDPRRRAVHLLLLTPALPCFLQISLVSQEPVLFARSIADNISYGLTSASFESVVQAAQKANAHSFITELQDGYHTGTHPAAGPGSWTFVAALDLYFDPFLSPLTQQRQVKKELSCQVARSREWRLPGP